MNLSWEFDMNGKNACIVRNGALLMLLACAVNGGLVLYGECAERLKDNARYEVRPLIDSLHNRIMWYVTDSAIDQHDDDNIKPYDVWRMRVRASLRSYRLKPDGVGLTVRLDVNPTIRRRIDEGCFVEQILGAKSQDFTFVGAKSLRKDGIGDHCQPSSFVLDMISSDVGRDDSITMCAYGKEFMHGEGATLECALFLIGLETLSFVYRVGDDVGVKSVRIPITTDSLTNGFPEVSGGTVGIYGAKHSVSVSVEHEHETMASRLGKFLILTVQGPDAFVDLPISMKNVLSFRESLKAQLKGFDYSWRAGVTENDRSPLFF